LRQVDFARLKPTIAKPFVSGDLFTNHDLCNPGCNIWEPQFSMNIHKSPIIGGKKRISDDFWRILVCLWLNDM
jgi:hypothetical protein